MSELHMHAYCIITMVIWPIWYILLLKKEVSVVNRLGAVLKLFNVAWAILSWAWFSREPYWLVTVFEYSLSSSAPGANEMCRSDISIVNEVEQSSTMPHRPRRISHHERRASDVSSAANVQQVDRLIKCLTITFCIQCFDTVGGALARASGL